MYPGDHGVVADAADGRRVGLLELSDRLRWVPEQGEGWDVPMGEVVVRTPVPRFGTTLERLTLDVPGVGTVRVQGASPSTVFGVSAASGRRPSRGSTTRIWRDLLRYGAVEGWGDASPDRAD